MIKTKDFFFDLPEDLIAQFPVQERGESRLMTLDRVTGKITHRMVKDLPDILCGESFLSPSGEKPLLVFNDTKVRKARLSAVSLNSGSKAEFLLLDKTDNGEWKTLVQHSKRRKTGSVYVFFNSQDKEIARAEITGVQGDFKLLKFENDIDEEWIEKYGHIPLPPYIKRKDELKDNERYQTIYAKETGSAAAPTAGLHFTNELLENLAQRGIERAFVTLHVGLGTFLPVRSVNIEDHIMHEEKFFIDEQNALKIENAKKEGRKIIAVGTTSVRTLESAWHEGKLKRGESSTSIFIYPGYKFKIADVLFTNFHTPLSTLLMLVCAFAGKEKILESYESAVNDGYRFFSYGDAMLIY
jgi:S-adenosylmethionine:tRNA ribosyltransferase-isomerase